MSVLLRAAGHGDREAVVEVFLACWRESYAGILPGEAIEAMTDERASAIWAHAFEAEDSTVVVAEDRHGVLGVTRFGITEGTGVVHSLYVSPRNQGMGIGGRLLQHAAADMTAEGAETLSLWVFAANRDSLSFYRGRGWLPDGGSRTQDEFGVPELRLGLAGALP